MTLADILRQAQEKCDDESNELLVLRAENKRLRSMLSPYADATSISGTSWNGFYLIGDDKSIKEFSRLKNDADQIKSWREGFDQHMAAAKQKNERLRFKLNEIRKVLKGEQDDE